MSTSSPVLASSGRVARRRAATRARLLQAAQRLAGDDASVTVAQIAAEADVALASFYTHFESKEALFAELIRDTMAGLATRLATLSAADDPALAFAAALRAFWAWFTEDADRGRYVLRAAHANDVLASTVGVTLAELIERGRQAAGSTWATRRSRRFSSVAESSAPPAVTFRAASPHPTSMLN